MKKGTIVTMFLLVLAAMYVLSGCGANESTSPTYPTVTGIPTTSFDLSVEVKDVKTGLGIPLAKVSLTGPVSRSENTNQQGVAYFTKVEEGTFNISATAQNYYSVSSQTHLGKSTSLSYSMEKLPVVVDNPGKSTLTVKALDVSKNPIGFATVRLTHSASGTTYNGQTDPDGKALFDKLQLGRFKLIVSKSGYDTYQVDNVWLEEGDYMIYEVALNKPTTPTGNAQVTVK